jgi:hypothetical protein
MIFEKGNKFGKGRPKGSPNKMTAQTREFLEQVTESLNENLLNDIQELSAFDRVKLWLSLQEFLIPKLSRTEIREEGENQTQVTINVVSPEPDYSQLSTEELKFLESIAHKVKYFDKPILEEPKNY